MRTVLENIKSIKEYIYSMPEYIKSKKDYLYTLLFALICSFQKKRYISPSTPKKIQIRANFELIRIKYIDIYKYITITNLKTASIGFVRQIRNSKHWNYVHNSPKIDFFSFNKTKKIHLLAFWGIPQTPNVYHSKNKKSLVYQGFFYKIYMYLLIL